MSRSKPKRGRYGNFTCRKMSSRDLLSICEQAPSSVPNVEINLYCSEDSDSIDLFDDSICSRSKHLKTDVQCVLNRPSDTPRDVPPNSPINLTETQQTNTNPFVSYLLSIWSEQKFNSPQVDSFLERNEAPDSPALVFEDQDVEHLPFVDSGEHSCENVSEDYHIVPDVGNWSVSQNEFESTEDYNGQMNRILNSCVSADHIVPVKFLEE